MIIIRINKNVELIAAAPKTAPPRLKITLKLTDIPKAAIAIPKKHKLLELSCLRRWVRVVKKFPKHLLR